MEVVLSETGAAEGLGEALRGLAVRAVEETLRLEAPRLEEVARGEGWPAAEAVEVGLTLTDDASIRELNRTYLARDSATDVLAFFMGGPPVGTEGDAGGPRASALREPLLLGDVVVSLETVRTQAVEWGRPQDEELARVVAHGVLHLLGYGDDTEAARADMHRREDVVLRSLGFEPGDSGDD